MYYADCHTHSKFSYDELPDVPSSQIEALCESAISAGMDEIAVTDHYDVNAVLECGVKADPVAAGKEINAAKEKYAGRLQVSFGIEISQAEEYPDHINGLLSSVSFDYVLGSLHSLPGKQDLGYYDYKEMSQEEIEELFEETLGYLMQICDFRGINAIAHCTFMHRFVKAAGKDIDFGKHHSSIGDLFRKIIHTGKSLEVNTSGMSICRDLTFPSHELVRYYRELGGEMVTCGSDTHGTDDYGVGNGIKITYEFLKEAGFRYITVFHEGRPFMKKLD